MAWGNSAPLALSGFAVTTFMLSMVNANLVPVGVTAVVFGAALMFGGLTQLIAGVIQLRTGNRSCWTNPVRRFTAGSPTAR